MNLIKHKQDQLKYLDLYREKARKHQQAIEQGRQALVNVGKSQTSEVIGYMGDLWLTRYGVNRATFRGRDPAARAGQGRARTAGRRTEPHTGRGGQDEQRAFDAKRIHPRVVSRVA
jgi:hypothetical protein